MKFLRSGAATLLFLAAGTWLTQGAFAQDKAAAAGEAKTAAAVQPADAELYDWRPR